MTLRTGSRTAGLSDPREAAMAKLPWEAAMAKGDPPRLGDRGRKGGRPRIEIDMTLLANLVRILCTKAECSGVLGVSESTIGRRLQEETGEGFDRFYKKHSAEGRVSLRRAQFDLAIGDPDNGIPPHPTMLIWLGKQWLGQRDTQALNLADADGKRIVFKVVIPGVTDGVADP